MQLRSLLLLALVPVILAGCGSGSDSSDNPHGSTAVAASRTCAATDCHGSDDSDITLANIVQEWQLSPHSTSNAASCADCHEPGPAHPSLCAKCHGGGSFAAVKNPDQDQKCAKCHGPSFPSDVLMRLAPQHYGYSSATALPAKIRASYVSGQYVGRCSACHNSHAVNVTPQHRAWADSLHGDPKGVAWTYYDMKQDNRASCSRCHTTTGFKSFVTSNFTVPTKGFSTTDPRRELIACDACHGSYDYGRTIRKVPAFTAAPYKGYDGVSNARFPDVGASNLCIPCHSGLASGQAIESMPTANFSNASFVNSHYLAAAGLMYMQNGFTNFTSASAPIRVGTNNSTYGRTLSPDNLTTPGGIQGGTSSTHRKFGTPLVSTITYYNPEFFVAGVADTNGPCVTCHMNVSGVAARPGNGHSMKIDANAFSQFCINCHDSEPTHTEVVALTPQNFRTEFLKPQREAFEDSLNLLSALLLERHGVRFTASYPYFFDERLPLVNERQQPVKDWTRGGAVNGRKLMGAAFNLNLLEHDPAAYAHARSYSRRLIYDSIDFVDDGVINHSVGATAVAWRQNGRAVFIKDAKAFNVAGGGITTIYGTTTDAMLYLVGWSRSTGEWNAPERP